MSDLPFTTAVFIRAAEEAREAPRFRRRFRIADDRGPVTAATLSVTAEGIVEPSLDGVVVTPEVLIPGWTSYEWRLRVVSVDVTGRVHAGSEHEIALLVGNGWFRGRLGWMGARAVYGAHRRVLAELRLHFADGSTETVGTDTSWQVTSSGIVDDDLYDGQTIDAGPQTRARLPVIAEPYDRRRLVTTPTPPIVRHETLAPARSWRAADGAWYFDFGQNLVGWVRARVRGRPGHRLVVQHAEVLIDGELARGPLRSARAEDVLVLSGGDDDIEPTFTFHGFRYIRVEGWDEVEGELAAVVVGSALRRTGTFACSDPLLTRFHENVVWSLRGNTVGIPTDCPQRDERLGWTGDIAVFAPSACYLFDMNGFLRAWLADLRAEQAAAGGRVPYVVPDALKGWAVREGEQPESTAIWSDAAVWVPWALWQAGGDIDVLRESFASMRAHVDRVCARLSDRGVWEGDFQFGDWLDPTAPPDDPTAAIADPDVIATAALHRSVVLTAQTAGILGLVDEERRWHAAAQRVRHAFADVYVSTDGTIRSDAPAVYALALVSGVIDGPAAAHAGARLRQLVRESGHRIIAGFAGAPYLCEALTQTGAIDDAYALLRNTHAPSWLGPVLRGATTVWERWDSLRDDGSLNPGEMTSFNHYALGAVADWMHRMVVGIAPAAPGYARVRIDPRPGGGLAWAQGGLETPHGWIAVRWDRDPSATEGYRVRYCAPEGVAVELGEVAARHGTRLPEADMRALLASAPVPRPLETGELP
jgi:alpha-L-rhamnosidase